MSIKQIQKESIKKKGLNIVFPLKRSVDGAFATNETSLGAIKDDLKILLITNHGERLVINDFGSNLRPLLFENQGQDFENRIQDAIVSSIEKWMPFVTVKDIVVKTGQNDLNLDPNETTIKIFFSVNGSDLEDFLEVRLKT